MTKTSKTNASGRGKTTKPRGKAKSSKGEKSAQNNYSSTIATLSNSPMVSQSESLTPPNGNASNGSGAGPSSSFSGALTGASSSKVVETGETMDAVNALTTTGGSPSDGLSAVERAKRSAEQFTMSQLAKRRRKGLSPFPGSIGSPSSEEHTGLNGGPADEDGPEAESHRKYQKRLQKNRDSAFVSRIRRREYTRILESSLSAVEKEKDAAMAAFREMKRRFDVVSAELVGIKTAAASNFHTFVNPVMIPDMPPGVFIPPAEVGFHPGSYLSQKQQTYPGIVRDSHGNNIPPGSLTLPPSRPPPPSDGGGRSRPLMTTMYMVALVVGVLLPDFASRRTISTAVNKAITGVDTGGRIGVQPGVVVIAAATPAAEARDDQGGVAGRILSEKTGLDPSEVLTMGADLSQGAADRLVDAVRADAMTRLGEQVGERTLDAVRRHLRSLRTHEVATIEQYCREDGLHDGFEALLRAVLREDGDHAKEEDSLDDIAALVAGLNFEDRL